MLLFFCVLTSQMGSILNSYAAKLIKKPCILSCQITLRFPYVAPSPQAHEALVESTSKRGRHGYNYTVDDEVYQNKIDDEK